MLTSMTDGIAGGGFPITSVGDSEHLLLDGLRRGDESAIETLVDRYGARIHRLALRMLGDPRDAEEVAQDVLLTVVRKIATFKEEAALSSWIYRIAANAAYQRLRSRRSRAEVSLEPFLPVFDEEGRHAEPVIDWSSRLGDAAVARETREAIERGISRLAPEYRIVVVLRDIEGLSTEEAAAALHLSVAAVKSRLHRARLFLRQELTRLFPPAH